VLSTATLALVHPAILESMRQGCSTIAPVYHFCSVATLPTIHQRLQARGDGPGSWPWRKAAQYIPQLAAPSNATHLDTERHITREIIDHVVTSIAL
jgi:hypothetical protein